MIKEQCQPNNRDSVACHFLSGICLGGQEGPSVAPGGEGVASGGLIPLETPTEDDEEPPDIPCSTSCESFLGSSLGSSAGGGGGAFTESRSRKHTLQTPYAADERMGRDTIPSTMATSAYLSGLRLQQTSTALFEPLAIDTDPNSTDTLKFVDQAATDVTLVPAFSRLDSNKSNSESTDGGSSSGGGTTAAKRGLFSPISLAKTWGQQHSKSLLSAMKKRTVSLDSNSAAFLYNGCGSEDSSWAHGYDSSDRSSQRFVYLSGDQNKAPFAMFSSIKYSRANNKACLAPATRPRGLKVLPVPTSSDRFLVHQLEEVILVEIEDKDPCVSYSLFLNNDTTFSNYICSSVSIGPNLNRKNVSRAAPSPPIQGTQLQLENPIESGVTSAIGPQHESYLVPVFVKNKSNKQSTYCSQQSCTSVIADTSENCSRKSSGRCTWTEIQSQKTVSGNTTVLVEFLPDQVKFLTNTFSPGILDDPSLNHASKTCMKLPGYRFSLLPHEQEPTSKQHVNERFKDRFPYIQLTLTKLRSMKYQLSKYLYEECQLDLYIAAYAVTYFEKLVFSERVAKHNRRYCAAACALIAAKLNDVKGAQLSKLVTGMCSMYKISRQDLLAFEFVVLVGLKFNLLVSHAVLCPIYRNLTQLLTWESFCIAGIARNIICSIVLSLSISHKSSIILHTCL